MVNIIDAIINLVNNPIIEIKNFYNERNRANSVGDSLEEYIKDLFVNSFYLNEQERLEKISQFFSYLGNNSNPPDMMLRNGDAIEVKKMENITSEIQLNSSYPKEKLYSSSSMISKECKIAEKWNEKDMLYIVGSIKKNKLEDLFFVYGIDYAANEHICRDLKDKLKEGINNTEGIEFSETKELGRINKIDPLGITSLRIRGMWLLKNPWETFKYVYTKNKEKKFNFCAIVNDEKYNSFKNTDILEKISSSNKSLVIKTIKIKNPNNPAKLRNAKMITFSL